MTSGLRQRLARPGLLVAPGIYDMVSLRVATTPEQSGDQLRADLAKYGQVVKAAGIKAE